MNVVLVADPVDLGGLEAALADAGKSVVLAPAGVAVDAALAAALGAAIDRGAACAGAAVLDGAALDVGSMLVPWRGAYRAEHVTVAASSPPAVDFAVDIPAAGAIAVRTAELRAALAILPTAAVFRDLVATIAAMLREHGRPVVCAARAVIVAPRDARRAQHGDRPSAVRTSLTRPLTRAGEAPFEVVPHPATTVFVYGDERDRRPALDAARATRAPLAEVRWSTDAAADLQRALARRGDRYVALVDAACPPLPGWLEHAIDDLEGFVECGARVDRGTLLFAARNVPAHVVVPLVAPADLAGECAGLLADAGRGTRDATSDALVAPLQGRRVPPTISCIFLGTSRPGTMRSALDALLGAIPMATEIVAITHASSDVARRIIGAQPNVRLELEYDDPLLGPAVNRVLAGVQSDLVVITSDEASLLPGFGESLVRAATARPDVGAFGIRLGTEDPVHAPSDLTSYEDEFAMRQFADARSAKYRDSVRDVDVLRMLPIVLDRRALELLGGCIPELSATTPGLEDLAVRLRCAGYGLAIVEEAFAHRFPASDSRSVLVAPSAAHAIVRKRYASNDVGAIVAGGLVPARDRVAPPSSSLVPPAVPRMTLACPAGDDAEWDAALALVRRALDTWTVNDPVAIAIGVDGPVPLPEAVRRVRDVVAKSPLGISRTPTIRIGGVADGDWSRLLCGTVLVPGARRPALAAFPAVALADARALQQLSATAGACA